MKKRTLLGMFSGSLLMFYVSGCGGGGGPAVQFEEDFESYAVAPNWTSPGWTDYNTGNATTWDVVSDSGSNVLCHTQYSGLRVYDGYTGSDYTVSARMKPGNAAASAGLAARFADSNHYYGLTLEAGTLTLRKFPQDGTTPPFAAFSFNTATYYTLTLKAAGHLITGRVTDGVTTVTVTIDDDGTYGPNPANASGKAGVFEYIQIGACFDEIEVTEP